MGYISVIAPCLCCKKIFSFHPNKVPSLNGEPVCKECVDVANPIRISKGLPPITYAPDAYTTSQDENDINWG